MGRRTRDLRQRPASVYEHRAVWSMLNGLSKSPFKPSLRYNHVQYVEKYTDFQEQHIPKQKKKMGFIFVTGNVKLPILDFIPQSEGF